MVIRGPDHTKSGKSNEGCRDVPSPLRDDTVAPVAAILWAFLGSTWDLRTEPSVKRAASVEQIYQSY